MTDFAQRAGDLLGGEGWVRRIADGTGIDHRTLRRMAQGKREVPDVLSAAIGIAEGIVDDIVEQISSTSEGQLKDFAIGLVAQALLSRIDATEAEDADEGD